LARGVSGSPELRFKGSKFENRNRDWQRFPAAFQTRPAQSCLSRSAVRNFTNCGVAQTKAMSITGHVTDSVFRRYNIQNTTNQSAAFSKVRAAS